MKAQLDLLHNILQFPDDVTITIENSRCKLPTAYYYPARNEILIVANRPALMRYALAELISHELAERDFHFLFKEEEDSEGNSHDDTIFHEIEREYRQRIDEAICREHD